MGRKRIPGLTRTSRNPEPSSPWRNIESRAMLAVAGAVGLALSGPAPAGAQGAAGDPATGSVEPPAGFSVEGVVRSTRGGFGFPDGTVMSAPPRLGTGGPFDCAPGPGNSESCEIEGRWDLCALAGIAMARFNAFVEPQCAVVDHGNGRWSIDVASSGQFVIRCSARCLRLSGQ